MMNLDLDDYYIGREKIITVAVVAAPTGVLHHLFRSLRAFKKSTLSSRSQTAVHLPKVISPNFLI